MGDYVFKVEADGYAVFEAKQPLTPGEEAYLGFPLLDAAAGARQTAIRAFNAGVQAFNKNDIATAKASFLEATAADPEMIEPYQGPGRDLLPREELRGGRSRGRQGPYRQARGRQRPDARLYDPPRARQPGAHRATDRRPGQDQQSQAARPPDLQRRGRREPEGRQRAGPRALCQGFDARSGADAGLLEPGHDPLQRNSLRRRRGGAREALRDLSRRTSRAGASTT